MPRRKLTLRRRKPKKSSEEELLQDLDEYCTSIDNIDFGKYLSLADTTNYLALKDAFNPFNFHNKNRLYQSFKIHALEYIFKYICAVNNGLIHNNYGAVLIEHIQYICKFLTELRQTNEEIFQYYYNMVSLLLNSHSNILMLSLDVFLQCKFEVVPDKYINRKYSMDENKLPPGKPFVYKYSHNNKIKQMCKAQKTIQDFKNLPFIQQKSILTKNKYDSLQDIFLKTLRYDSKNIQSFIVFIEQTVLNFLYEYVCASIKGMNIHPKINSDIKELLRKTAQFLIYNIKPNNIYLYNYFKELIMKILSETQVRTIRGNVIFPFDQSMMDAFQDELFKFENPLYIAEEHDPTDIDFAPGDDDDDDEDYRGIF